MSMSIVTVVGYPPAGSRGAKPRRLIGTAIAIADDRLVTTSSLAIPGGRVQVLLDRGIMRDAHLIGVDRRSNVALFRVEGQVLHSLRQGAPRSVATGAWVAVVSNVAINRPQAALGRVVGRGDQIDAPYAGEILEIDAPSYPGATGGAVLNEDGDWVAVVVGRAGSPPAREGSGVGAGEGEEAPTPNHVLMALPAEQVSWIAKELETYGGVRHGFLGVRLQRSSNAESVGVFVADVVSGSPAEAAGIKPGDRILAVDGVEVHAPDALTQLVRSGKPGDEIELTMFRGGEIFAVSAVVGAAFSEPPIGPRPSREGEAERLRGELDQLERERRRIETRIREIESQR
jgi:S1-C subfamily serine protease